MADFSSDGELGFFLIRIGLADRIIKLRTNVEVIENGFGLPRLK
jgi:hypothetical protein